MDRSRFVEQAYKPTGLSVGFPPSVQDMRSAARTVGAVEDPDGAITKVHLPEIHSAGGLQSVLRTDCRPPASSVQRDNFAFGDQLL